MSSTLVVAAARNSDSTPRGLVIDVFNSGGGCCRISQQQLLGGPSSTSSTLVVVVARNSDSTPRGARHRCLPKLGTCR
jgi:hypothetical protein